MAHAWGQGGSQRGPAVGGVGAASTKGLKMVYALCLGDVGRDLV